MCEGLGGPDDFAGTHKHALQHTWRRTPAASLCRRIAASRWQRQHLSPSGAAGGGGAGAGVVGAGEGGGGAGVGGAANEAPLLCNRAGALLARGRLTAPMCAWAKMATYKLGAAPGGRDLSLAAYW